RLHNRLGLQADSSASNTTSNLPISTQGRRILSRRRGSAESGARPGAFILDFTTGTTTSRVLSALLTLQPENGFTQNVFRVSNKMLMGAAHPRRDESGTLQPASEPGQGRGLLVSWG